jgi:hypothetical protein
MTLSLGTYLLATFKQLFINDGLVLPIKPFDGFFIRARTI